MKRLILFRHAKTERDSNSGRDFDRRLTERGQSDAKRIGEEIRRLDLMVDLVVSSPAARAAETAQLAGLEPRFDERIYDAAPGDLLSIVQCADNSIGSLMMIGHNPGFERLASRLTGQHVELPTGSLAEIAVPVEQWSEAGGGAAKLVRLLKPRELD